MKVKNEGRSKGEIASYDDVLMCETPRKKRNSALESIGASPVNMHGIAQHSRTLMEKVN